VWRGREGGPPSDGGQVGNPRSPWRVGSPRGRCAGCPLVHRRGTVHSPLGARRAARVGPCHGGRRGARASFDEEPYEASVGKGEGPGLNTRAFVANASENAFAVVHGAAMCLASPALRQERLTGGWAIWALRWLQASLGVLRRLRVDRGAMRPARGSIGARGIGKPTGRTGGRPEGSRRVERARHGFGPVMGGA